MHLEYKVRQGDDIASIAYQYGLLPETIWNDPTNVALRNKRKDPYVLYPGDIVFIPETRIKEERGSTEKRHRFRRKSVPEVLQVRLLDEDGNPIANVEYILDVDGNLKRGTTNENGVVRQNIPPNASQGKLIIESIGAEYELLLGGVDPLDTTTGLQARLNNLGFACGPVDGERADRTEGGIADYREVVELSDADENDNNLKQHIKQQHGS
ncbi:hypothetical protein THIOM_000834 [Candidatus Thiomargarita nelsonii]|uniref:LysM domain-containing protein n=1 Tax=Candidatus Thiomargarita nelsonii TaxID=1003181 RepID=A0A176S5U6_9GAMM|nr:hypothetical protein THIOM_000834 [Candidatus Thiomargarita nelsonii]